MKRFVSRIIHTSTEYSCHLQQPNSLRTWRVLSKEGNRSNFKIQLFSESAELAKSFQEFQTRTTPISITSFMA